MAALVRPMAKAGPEELCGVVERDEKPRQDRGQRQLDDHHPVHRRRCQHHDRAQRHLHEPKPGDAEPGERHPRPLSATAVTIMPEM